MAEQAQMVRERVPGPPIPRLVGAAATMELTPKEIVGILRRHILLVIVLTIMGFVAGGASWYLLLRYLPKYTAQTLIRVLPPVQQDPMQIAAAQVGKDLQYSARASMAELILQQSTMQLLIARDKIQATKWFKSFGQIKDKRFTKAVRYLKKHLGAYAQRDADTVVLSMTCGDKAESALIVNELAELFVRSQGSDKRNEIDDKLIKLEDRRNSVLADLNGTLKALNQIRVNFGIIDLEEHSFQDTITRKLDILEIEQDSLAQDIKEIETNIDTLKRQATGPVNEQIEHQIETDPVMIMLAQQLALEESALAARLTKFGENHRVVREAQERINEIKARRFARKAEIAEQTRQANLKNAQDQLVVSLSRLEELNKRREASIARKKDIDEARVQYQQGIKEREERRQMLDSINGQIEKLRIVKEDPETPKVQLLGIAPEPLDVSSPRWEVYFPGGTLLGCMLGIGLAFLIELLNDLVRTPKDVVKYLHIPLLGIVPDAQEDELAEDIDLCHIVRQAPYSIISESYRRFRTNLKLSGDAASSKILLITSGMAGEGKTTVAVNIAEIFVAENKKVLLIDANFRRPSLHKIFPRPAAENETAEESEFGLSTLLNGLCGYQEVIRPSGIQGLDIIDAGPLPTNPAELLGGEQMEQLLKRQGKNYDYVAVDSPPLLLVSEAKMLARLVDSTILVFNANTTRRGAALRTIRELRDVDAKIVGCVLLAVKAMKGGYFHEQFRSYQEYQKLLLANPA
jgi:capsular exopolysaccharide synthesis family protein